MPPRPVFSGSSCCSAAFILSLPRLVFVSKNFARNAADQFTSFDMPLAHLSNERFNQPIFGANNLTGTIGRWQVGPSKFTITFREGACVRACGKAGGGT